MGGKVKDTELYKIVADFTFGWEYWLGPDDQFLYISPSCKRITGYARDEFERNPSLLPDIIHDKKQQVKDKLSARKNRSSGSEEIEFRIRHKSGQIRWISHISQPVFLPDRSYAGRRASNRDITDKKEIEEALRNSEELHRATLNNISDAVFLTADDGNFTFVCPNVHVIFGYSQEEVWKLGNIRCLLGKDIYDPEQLQEKKELPNIDCVIHDCRGRKHYLAVSVKQVSIYGATVLYVCRDLTEKKKAEEQAKLHQLQLIQADRLKSLGVLVAGVAHEINNPNFIIQSNIGLFEDFVKGIMPVLDEYQRDNGSFSIGRRTYTELRDEVSEYITAVKDSTERISHIVKSLKEFAGHESAEMLEKVNLILVVKAAVTLASNFIKKSTDFFSVDYPEFLPAIRGNFQRLVQVVLNLIENACQALPDKSRAINIRFKNNTGVKSITLIVEDEGSGISEENLGRIKDPFFTTKRERGGTGLGLSVSSSIVEEHGGTLEFYSSDSEGTRAYLTLPAETGAVHFEERG